MQLANAPAKLSTAFASLGLKNTIPVASTGVPGGASWDVGFPPETMLDPADGGTGPSGLDFNGIYNALSALSVAYSAGLIYPYDAAFSALIGGYAHGALVAAANGNGYWRSTVDNNVTDPDTGGAGWAAFGVSANSSVYASAQQTLAVGSSKVLFDSTEFDNGLWNAGAKRFVAPFAGKFRISGAVMLSAPGGQLLASQVYQNGALAKECFQAPQVSNGNLSLPFDAVIQCAAGDYLEVYIGVTQTAVLAGNVGSNQAYVFAQCNFIGA